MLRIDKIDALPFESIQYYTIPSGEIEAEIFSLPIYSGIINNLPTAIDAIIVTSDLQGVVKVKEEILLLGEYLADNLKTILDLYFSKIKKEKVLVLLCGDLYTSLIKRGDSGDPSEVWKKFSSIFGNVIGIAGNHDCFENGSDSLNKIDNICFLENGIVKYQGLLLPV
jgi:Icc protein